MSAGVLCVRVGARGFERSSGHCIAVSSAFRLCSCPHLPHAAATELRPSPLLLLLQVWLREKGSPASVIERAVFSSERLLESLSFAAFERKPGRLP